jgi:hypothetical protein
VILQEHREESGRFQMRWPRGKHPGTIRVRGCGVMHGHPSR